jgi:hypothetical protein
VESLMKSMRDKTSICRLRAAFRWKSNQNKPQNAKRNGCIYLQA